MPSAPLLASNAADDAAVARVTPADAPRVALPVAQARPRHAAPRHVHAAPHAHHAKHSTHAAALARGGFHLKLSGPVLDLQASRNITEAQRALLREARTLLDGDDYASAMLALRDRIDTLQKRLEALQSQAVRLEAAQAKPQPALAAREREAPSLGFAQGAWSWALVALLGLAALLLSLTSWLRRRKPGAAVEPEVKALPPDAGTETGRFAPPPPHVLAPGTAAPSAAPIAMEDTEEAIRSARDLYNAGERLQAAGVLRLAIESHPERVAPWLPLFDLLMRERLATEYAELARGFRALHGSSPAWKTVQRAGQQLDPGNPLYAEEEARQVAA
jgi:uncharacterized protein YciI